MHIFFRIVISLRSDADECSGREGCLRIIYSGWGKAKTGSCFVSADWWLCIRVNKQRVRVHQHRTTGTPMATVLRRSNTAETAPACYSPCVDGPLYCQTLHVNITIDTAFLYVYFLLHVLLTVHPVTTPVNNQLDAQFLYFYSLHVSDSYVYIIRRINSINTTSGMSLCVDDRLVCIPDGHLHRGTTENHIKH